MHNNLQFSDIQTILKWASAVGSEWRLYESDVQTLKRLLMTCNENQRNELQENYPVVFREIEKSLKN